MSEPYVAHVAEVNKVREADTAEWLEQLATVTDPLAVLILKHHSRTGSIWICCEGCDIGGGFESESPDWPCSTVRLVAEYVGCPAPEYVRIPES